MAKHQCGQLRKQYGWTLHTFMLNESADRRIGLNIQYIVLQMRQLNDIQDSANVIQTHSIQYIVWVTRVEDIGIVVR